MPIRSIAIILSIPYFLLPQSATWYFPLIFWLGIVMIGIPHGAVDHHIQLKDKATDYKSLIKFVGKYIGLMMVFLLFWFIAPTASIILFILISSYHFGMVDFGHPRGFMPRVLAIIYGLTLLGSIIFSDKETVSSILSMLSVGSSAVNWYNNSPIYMPYALIILTSCIVILKKIHQLWWTIALLLLGTKMPLLLTFGLYFSFQHALESSLEIKSHLKKSVGSLIKMALPFSLGAYMIGAIVYILINRQLISTLDLVPYAFLFLGMVTLPHIFYYSFEKDK